MTVVISDTLGAYGGTHTLTLRICKWLERNGYSSVVFCENESNWEIVTALKHNNTKIYCLNTSDTDKIYELIKNFKIEGNLTVISYMWDKYLDMEILKHRKDIDFNNILYCVHYGTFMKGVTYPSILKRVVKSNCYSIFNKMNSDKAVVMMDEDTTNKTAKWFSDDCIPNNPFVRIPMICEERQDSAKMIKDGYDGDIIMSASRAEFPYKGYQIGLIKEFESIKEKRRSAKLLMISGGNPEDVRILTDEIKRLPRAVQNDIEFHNWMDYEELKSRIEKCKVFVGMGTSVLDAGLKYKPAIPVQYNTYEVIASGFLSEKPEFIVAAEDSKIFAIELIMRVFNMSFDEYRAESIKTFNAVKKCYDIDKNMRVLLNVKPKKTQSILNNKDIAFINMLRLAGHIRHRKNMMFDVANIERE